MSATAIEPEIELSPEAERFCIAFDRLSLADQKTVAVLIDLLGDEWTRSLVEALCVAAESLDDVREIIPATRGLQ